MPIATKQSGRGRPRPGLLRFARNDRRLARNDGGLARESCHCEERSDEAIQSRNAATPSGLDGQPRLGWSGDPD
ncbi:MAG: hypothetical protein LBT00_06055 [Spirochaetaceae bacterium]|nr:hypothetical protein [Spirochaetaceae bacterium]